MNVRKKYHPPTCETINLALNNVILADSTLQRSTTPSNSTGNRTRDNSWGDIWNN